LAGKSRRTQGDQGSRSPSDGSGLGMITEYLSANPGRVPPWRRGRNVGSVTCRSFPNGQGMEHNQVEHHGFQRVRSCRAQVITEMLDHIERGVLNAWAGSRDLGLNGVGDHHTIHLEPVKEDEQLRSVAPYRVLGESFSFTRVPMVPQGLPIRGAFRARGSYVIELWQVEHCHFQ